MAGKIVWNNFEHVDAFFNMALNKGEGRIARIRRTYPLTVHNTVNEELESWPSG